MKILVASDSHGNYRALIKAVEACKPFDAFIFLGDGENDFNIAARNMSGISTYRVRGNNDWDSSIVLSAVVELDSHKLFLTHGNHYALAQGYERLISAANQNGCQAALFGHTHSRHYSFENGVHLFNPGSVAIPRDGRPRSYGVITEENGRLDFYHFDIDR
ncbi:MAG: metallophosphoesterase [Bacteroides sp.]|nr:metallophosphoesterase [Bacteroides sp.]